MKYVTLTCITGEDIIEEKEVCVCDKYDLFFEIELFADKLNVDIDRINYDIDPVDYIDLFGITFFGDREEQ